MLDSNSGPYKPANMSSSSSNGVAQADAQQAGEMRSTRFNHDTISLLALAANGSVRFAVAVASACCAQIAAGTSTNGARNKVPGRVGDG